MEWLIHSTNTDKHWGGSEDPGREGHQVCPLDAPGWWKIHKQIMSLVLGPEGPLAGPSHKISNWTSFLWGTGYMPQHLAMEISVSPGFLPGLPKLSSCGPCHSSKVYLCLVCIPGPFFAINPSSWSTILLALLNSCPHPIIYLCAIFCD